MKKFPSTPITKHLRLNISSGFVLLFSLIYFFDTEGFLGACLPAVLFHELGHFLAMRYFNVRKFTLNATVSGLSMDYIGELSGKKEVIVALAGPIFGFFFAVLCSYLGGLLGSKYLTVCAGVGFVLNIYNLLPAMPLDGGRILSALLPSFAMKHLGYGVCVLLCATGVYVIFMGYGLALLLSGIWLLLLQKDTQKNY